MKNQVRLDIESAALTRIPRIYHEIITASVNHKGCMDVDTVKGCTLGMRAGKNGRGCYDECYANEIASRYGIDFGQQRQSEVSWTTGSTGTPSSGRSWRITRAGTASA